MQEERDNRGMGRRGMRWRAARISLPMRVDTAASQGQLFITQEGPGVAISKIPFSILTEVPPPTPFCTPPFPRPGRRRFSSLTFCA